jgi:hypothetical protein
VCISGSSIYISRCANPLVLENNQVADWCSGTTVHRVNSKGTIHTNNIAHDKDRFSQTQTRLD